MELYQNQSLSLFSFSIPLQNYEADKAPLLSLALAFSMNVLSSPCIAVSTDSIVHGK